MDISERNRRSKPYVRFRTVFDYVMGVFYIAGGLVVIFSKRLGIEFNLSFLILAAFGGLLIAYGLFRLYRGWKHIF